MQEENREKKMTRKKEGRTKNQSLDKAGIIKMVEVAEKPETLRQAEARGEVKVSAEVMQLITGNRLPKGDVLTAARLAGIQAAKKTSELIPLCHPLRITSVEVEVDPRPGRNLVEVKSSVRAVDRTGVEMEALTAVAVACLTVYDMCKAFDKRMIIGEIHLVSKSGGKSGDFHW
jgi:cyclic pyranopterin phosphate synthase